MNNKDLMECIAAESEGKKIECRIISHGAMWMNKEHTGWATQAFEEKPCTNDAALAQNMRQLFPQAERGRSGSTGRERGDIKE